MKKRLIINLIFLRLVLAITTSKSHPYFITNKPTLDASQETNELAATTEEISCGHHVPANYDMTFLERFKNLKKIKGVDCEYTTFNFTVYNTSGHLIELNHVETLKVEDGRIEVIEGHSFQSLPGLRKLKLPNNKISTIKKAAFVGLTELKKLDLPTNRIETLPDDVFSELTALMELDLSHNRMKIVDLIMFETNGNLKVVDVKENPIVEVKVFHRCRKVRWISEDVVQTDPSYSTDAKLDLTIDASVKWRKQNMAEFVVVSAANCNETRSVHQKLRRLDSVVDMDISNNGIQMIQAKDLGDMPILEHLQLENNRLTTVYYSTFIEKFPRLNHITLANNPWNCQFLTEMIPFLDNRTIIYPKTTTKTLNVNGVSCQLTNRDYRRRHWSRTNKFQKQAITVAACLSVLMLFLYVVNVYIQKRTGRKFKCCVIVG